ncbi:MAG TPA: hypothetical protein VFA11_10850 [Acidimicrobiales bacterium]|nr:hypothetical protein [Acidimicrobiales bacterium]
MTGLTASRCRRLWLALAGTALTVGFGLSHETAHPDRRGVPAVVLAATAIAPTTAAPTAPATAPGPAGASAGSGQEPAPIQVGPTLPAPAAPAPGGGGTVAGGSAPSPGLFDITGHIEAAIDSWFRDLVTSALDPVLGLLGHSLLATPDVTGQDRVGQLWQMTAGIADGFLVLFLLVGAAIVMGHETLQTRTAAKDVLPRVVVGAVAANASLALAGLAISAADALSQALLGQGVGPAQASVVLRQLVLGSLAGGGIFTVLVGGAVAVLAVVLLCTWIVRVALTVILVVAAPVALVCHALPQTEGMARWWWRAFAATVGTQVAQSLVLVTALRVFLATGGPANLGLASTGGLVDLLVSACLCWVLVKIPFWASHVAFSGSRRHSSVGRVVRDVVIYKGVKALAAGAGL